jgi:hypothetical protein
MASIPCGESAVVPATVATGCGAETMRVRRCFGAPAGGPEQLGHNLAMPPSDNEANGTDRDVMTNLSRTRPARRSAKRDRPGRAGGAGSAASGSAGASAPSGASPGSPASTAAPDPKPAANATAARAKPQAASTRAKAKAASTGAKPKAASSRAKPASTARSRTATRAKARTAAGPATAPAKAPSVAAESAVPAAGYATEAPAHGPDPFAVVTTAVQAAGEIAQIGATLWGQAVRSAVSRLPRP